MELRLMFIAEEAFLLGNAKPAVLSGQVMDEGVHRRRYIMQPHIITLFYKRRTHAANLRHKKSGCCFLLLSLYLCE